MNTKITKLSNTTYDTLKWFVQIVLPAFGALYFGLSGYWDLPKADEVVGTCAVIATFLGIILGLSTKQYQNSDRPYDGTMYVTQDEVGTKTYSLELNDDVNNIVGKDSITFKTESKL